MSESTTPEPAQAKGRLRPDAPRLRIHHFFLWTLVTAVLLTVSSAINKSQGQFDFNSSQTAIYVVLASVPITVLLLGIRWWLASYRFFDQVGHWYALDLASALLLYLGVEFASLLSHYDSDYNGPNGTFNLLLRIVVRPLLMALIYFWVAWRVADTKVWKIFCLASAMKLLIDVGMFLGMWLDWFSFNTVNPQVIVYVVSTAVLFLLLAWAIRDDIRRKAVRHWSHWVVILMQLLSGGVTIAFLGYQMFVGFE